jgi:hypothetical protein
MRSPKKTVSLFQTLWLTPRYAFGTLRERYQTPSNKPIEKDRIFAILNKYLPTSPIRDFQLKKYPKISCSAGIWSANHQGWASCPLIIKDGHLVG